MRQTHETCTASDRQTFGRRIKMLLTPSDARATFVEALSSANRLAHVLPASLASLSMARTVGLAHTMIQRSEGLRGTLGPEWRGG